MSALNDPRLDEAFPERGPCGFCGFPDARHRLWDAMMSRADAGESVEAIATDYDSRPEHVQLVLQLRPHDTRPWSGAELLADVARNAHAFEQHRRRVGPCALERHDADAPTRRQPT